MGYIPFATNFRAKWILPHVEVGKNLSFNKTLGQLHTHSHDLTRLWNILDKRETLIDGLYKNIMVCISCTDACQVNAIHHDRHI